MNFPWKSSNFSNVTYVVIVSHFYHLRTTGAYLLKLVVEWTSAARAARVRFPADARIFFCSQNMRFTNEVLLLRTQNQWNYKSNMEQGVKSRKSYVKWIGGTQLCKMGREVTIPIPEMSAIIAQQMSWYRYIHAKKLNNVSFKKLTKMRVILLSEHAKYIDIAWKKKWLFPSFLNM